MTKLENLRFRLSILWIVAGLLVLGSDVSLAAGQISTGELHLVIVPDATTTIQFVDVEMKVAEGGVHVSGALRSKKLQQRLLQTKSRRQLFIQLRGESGEVRASKQIELPAHALHQHGSHPFPFNVILDEQPEPGDSVILQLESRRSVDDPSMLRTP